MSKFVRPHYAEAYQVTFDEKDKAKASKGLPVSWGSTHIKHENGEFSALIDLGHDSKLAKEGDWVVTEEDGKRLIMDQETFADTYIQAEDDEEDLEDSDAAEDENGEAGLEDPDGSESQEPTGNTSESNQEPDATGEKVAAE